MVAQGHCATPWHPVSHPIQLVNEKSFLSKEQAGRWVGGLVQPWRIGLPKGHRAHCSGGGSVNELPAVVAKETGGESKLRSDEPFLLHRDNITARWKYSGKAFSGNDGQLGE